jgi:hypothetical protein
MSVGALYKQQVCLDVVPRSEPRQEPVMCNLRFTPHGRVLHKKTPQGGVVTQLPAPYTLRRDYMSSFDLQDGFYTLGIAREFLDYFSLNVRDQLYRLA